jgi:DNA-binding NtrC family response regulator
MRRTLFVAAFVSALLVTDLPIIRACGDKVLRIGRGVRFQRTSHPVAVLIYIPSNAERATQLQSMLEKVGHASYKAQDVDSLRTALMSRRYDVVFTDLADAAQLEKQIEALPSKPVVVPVVSKESKAEISVAKKQYSCLVTHPHSGDHYLDAIDEAFRSKVHLLPNKAPKT